MERLALRAVTSGPGETRALAAAIAGVLANGDLLVLTGDLGAGKTCFAQGLGAGLGVSERITSPTFTLAARYEGRLRLHHLDVYRLDDIAETLDLDLPELLEDGVTVIEWGERIDGVLPADRLLVDLRYGDLPVDSGGSDEAASGEHPDPADRRTIHFGAAGHTWTARWEELRRAVEPWSTPC